jgi:hypothetical protein
MIFESMSVTEWDNTQFFCNQVNINKLIQSKKQNKFSVINIIKKMFSRLTTKHRK